MKLKKSSSDKAKAGWKPGKQNPQTAAQVTQVYENALNFTVTKEVQRTSWNNIFCSFNSLEKR